MGWVEHVAHMEERRGAYRVWWGNLRDRDYLEDNIKMNLQEVGYVAWPELIWFRVGQVVGTFKRGNEPLGFLTSLESVSFSRRTVLNRVIK
jgi:hypothetical protein